MYRPSCASQWKIRVAGALVSKLPICTIRSPSLRAFDVKAASSCFASRYSRRVWPTILSWSSCVMRLLHELMIPPIPPNSKCDLRSEEHTSELQSHLNLVCRLLLEKKKKDSY